MCLDPLDVSRWAFRAGLLEQRDRKGSNRILASIPLTKVDLGKAGLEVGQIRLSQTGSKLDLYFLYLILEGLDLFSGIDTQLFRFADDCV